MANELEAIGLNNCGVSLLERGAVWEALETFQYARACLDEEQPARARMMCQCRLLHASGPPPFFSLLENISQQRGALTTTRSLQLYEDFL
mmetsp:Transcript_99534/g.278746  ORF Transcript_99534/g.278746 Transcript_99534/m.278746 type:complete len:90 (-) Transcript_99534:10-279(-)